MMEVENNDMNSMTDDDEPVDVMDSRPDQVPWTFGKRRLMYYNISNFNPLLYLT